MDSLKGPNSPHSVTQKNIWANLQVMGSDPMAVIQPPQHTRHIEVHPLTTLVCFCED